MAFAPNEHDSHPARWRMLALLGAGELLGMSLWFAANAVSPQLSERWELGQSQTAWLTTIVQLGFVVGTAGAALLNLADILPARRFFAASALLGAVANASLVVAGGYRAALVSRFLTGFFLAGVYPPAMKMVATWFRSSRGLAIGTIVGALTVGKAAPYLLSAIPGIAVSPVVVAASAGAVAAALLVGFGYRDGPFPFATRPFSWSLAGTVLRERHWRLATGGYLGHMFELYSFWVWIPAFLTASEAARATTAGQTGPSTLVSLIAFGSIAVGGLGCVWGGWAADRIGRERIVTVAMAASGTCAVLTAAFFGDRMWLVAIIAWVWGFFVIADSAQFSALVTESVPPHTVGTALTIQTSLGFLLTMFSIQLVPPIVHAAGWRWAFPVLALGPAFGITAIRQLLLLKRARL